MCINDMANDGGTITKSFADFSWHSLPLASKRRACSSPYICAIVYFH